MEKKVARFLQILDLGQVFLFKGTHTSKQAMIIMRQKECVLGRGVGEGNHDFMLMKGKREKKAETMLYHDKIKITYKPSNIKISYSTYCQRGKTTNDIFTTQITIMHTTIVSTPSKQYNLRASAHER